VIATIHQPNSSTFKIFGRLLLMMEGHTIYQGKASNSAEYFSKLGYNCPIHSNPSDYFLREFSAPAQANEKYTNKLNILVSNYQKTAEEEKILFSKIFLQINIDHNLI
jgi:ABC-type multidrug transport system ATPase subunit